MGCNLPLSSALNHIDKMSIGGTLRFNSTFPRFLYFCCGQKIGYKNFQVEKQNFSPFSGNTMFNARG